MGVPEEAVSGVAGVPEGEAPPFRYGARLANEIEARWQRRWETEGTFHSPNPTGSLSAGFGRVAGRPRFYVLDMFPYPSGAGLHVGHPLGYIGTDVLARYQRMNGRHVMHALGYDAFGLPAEQYAIDSGQHPQVTTSANVATMRRQLRRLGLGHDARREIATTDVSFYRWTQWIFLQIFNSWVDERTGQARPIADLIAEFESGARPAPGGAPWDSFPERERRAVIDGYRLAYSSEELVNWCPGLGTVLANEEVTPDGRSDIGNYPVYRRPLRQWMLRITAFAERLIADLDELEWPESIKQLQRNWIGRSDGALITLPVAGDAGGADRGAAGDGRRRRPWGCRGRWRGGRGLHDPAGHPRRRHLHGARAGTSAGGPATAAVLAGRNAAGLDVPRRARRRRGLDTAGRGGRVPGRHGAAQ